MTNKKWYIEYWFPIHTIPTYIYIYSKFGIIFVKPKEYRSERQNYFPFANILSNNGLDIVWEMDPREQKQKK